MLYTEAVHRLQALGAELHTSPGQPRRKFELAQMRTLMAALGDPQQHFPSVLIAGTNGKGSTASTLAAILAASGLRTGLYTSPHLVRVNERIQILARASELCVISNPPDDTPDLFSNHVVASNFDERHEARMPEGKLSQGGQNSLEVVHEAPPEEGFKAKTSKITAEGAITVVDTPIPDEDFSRHLEAVIHAAERLVSEARLPGPPSFFETVTAMAFLHFAEAKVDIAVLEVGLGGRLDATNIVEPALSIITDISLDHTEWLGHTIAEIAHEKAGILRPNGILVTLPQHPEANQAIGETAVSLNVRAINATAALPFDTHAVTNTRNRYPLDIVTGKDEGLHIEVDSPLAGQHQQRNIALAITAALELRNILKPAESPIDSAPRTADPRVPHPEQNRDPQTARVSQVGAESEGWVNPVFAKRPSSCASSAVQPTRVPHPEQSEGWDVTKASSSRPERSEVEGPAFLAPSANPNVSDQRERIPQPAPQAQSPGRPVPPQAQWPRTADPRVPHPEQSEGWDTQPPSPGSIVIPAEAKRSGEPALSLSKGICFSPAPQPARVPHPEQSEGWDTTDARQPRSSEHPAFDKSTHTSYDINAAAIAAGIRQTRWPGRLEHLTRGTQHILLDVGHNPAGAWTLRAALAAEQHPPRVILFGCLDDKPVEELAQILFPLFDRVLLVPVPSPRAASGARLLAAAQSVTTAAAIQPDLVTALAAAAGQDAVGEDAVITGSVYLVGEARGLLMAEGWASDAG